MHCLILHITPEYRCVTKTMGRKGLLAKIQEGTSRLDFKQINRTVHNPVLRESLFLYLFLETHRNLIFLNVVYQRPQKQFTFHGDAA